MYSKLNGLTNAVWRDTHTFTWQEKKSLILPVSTLSLPALVGLILLELLVSSAQS